MYQTFYQLRAEPFRLTPDPRYRYEHPSYVKARSYLRYAMDRGEGFVVITGRPGTGKTTLIEEFLSGQSARGLVTARLLSTQMDTDDLLRMVAHGFGVQTGNADRVTVLHRLSRFLVTNAEAGRRAALIIDEAHDLTRDALEALRMLTNLQHGPRSVLQIFLIGQEQLRRVVYGSDMEQLRQRILVATRLEPLDAEQTRTYIQHRLQCAGGSDDPRLSDRAFALIHAASEGLPREINKICGRLLLHGSIEEKHTLTAADVLQVLDELRQEQLIPLDRGDAAVFGLDLSDTVEPPPGRTAAPKPADDAVKNMPTGPTMTGDEPTPETEDAPEPGGGPSGRTMPHFDPATSLSAVEEAESRPPGKPKKHHRLRITLIVLFFALLVAVPTLRREHNRPGGTSPAHRISSESISKSPAPAAVPAPTVKHPPTQQTPVAEPETPPPAEEPPTKADNSGPKPQPPTAKRNAPSPAKAPLASPDSSDSKSQPTAAKTSAEAPAAAAAAAPTETPAVAPTEAPAAAPASTSTPSPDTDKKHITSAKMEPLAATPGVTPSDQPTTSGATASASQRKPTHPVSAANKVTPPPATATSGRIAALLNRARQALQDYRLTIPAGNNAMRYYRRILRLQPGNQAAIQGLKQVESTYHMLIDQAIAVGDRDHALQLLIRARRVNAANPALDELQRRIEALKPAASAGK